MDMDDRDPGSLVDHTNKNQDTENNHPPGSVLDLEDLAESATLQNI